MAISSFSFKDMWGLLKETFKGWADADPFRLSAVVAYYAIFALPALLLIVVSIAGFIAGEAAVASKINGQISTVLGDAAGEFVSNTLDRARLEGRSAFKIILGLAFLLFASTGLFVQLQKSLNILWNVKADPKNNLLKVVIDRALSFLVIFVIILLIIVSFIISAAMDFAATWVTDRFPDITIYLFYLLNFLVSWGLVTLLFAFIFKVLPDVKVQWRSVWVGSGVTALLFLLGKFLLTFYFSNMDPGSAYGAAGSLIVLMLWIAYSSMILFFGAEFTQVFARRYGYRMSPAGHAVPREKC